MMSKAAWPAEWMQWVKAGRVRAIIKRKKTTGFIGPIEDDLEKETATLQYCLENATDRGTWQVTVHGVTKGWT